MSEAMRYEPIALSSESTVVAEYEFNREGRVAFQSEAELEAAFIKLLQDQAYERLTITSEPDLVVNLRKQLEKLNYIEFTDSEWNTFFKEKISGDKDGVVEKTSRIQEDHVQVLKREDGSSKNIRLIDKSNVHNNSLQVLNQYAVEGARANRYDVTILVNGLPLVHVELKRRGVDIREAFNQIKRYQRDSFWAGSGLFEYVQLFVISNGTFTKYYSNSTRLQHLREGSSVGRAKQTSNSFEFTSWWADGNNKPITDLMAFGKTFFAKHSLLNVLTRYCVFTHDRMLLVMRPYQIFATERILQRVVTSGNYKKYGTVDGGGYVWHTTGSGKTLTSFKAAQLVSRIPEVEKVLFIVDRKDLDYQTQKEYDKFDKGAANGNTSTRELARQLGDSKSKIVITTIQKLALFIKANPGHAVYSGRVVLIFDECHRSQFGDMHDMVRKAFKQYHLFGFTGTPIFAENSPSAGQPLMRTTEQVFGEKLHTYTIVDAINDKNVLPFRIDYVNTFKLPEGLTDAQVRAIDRERALLAPERIDQIVAYIRQHFNQKTRRNESYVLADRRLRGFNSILATASIDAAKIYYNAFARAQEGLPEDQKLKIATIFSWAANEETADGFMAEEGLDATNLDKSSRDFLEDAIQDYNAMFGMSFDTSAEGFQNYYKDLSKRLKERDVDLVIVVNMFLTGFDATTLNTLWVDKNLRQHGLIQAFSRTNRILNSIKAYGNIVSFRNLEQETNEAIALFGNKEAGGIVLLRPFNEYYDEYAEKVTQLQKDFEPGVIPMGEEAQKAFINLYNEILRLKNILVSFDDFYGNEILSPADFQDYQSAYIEIWRDRSNKDSADKESINDDLVFEIELIKQIEINVDYILMLVKKLNSGSDDKEIKASISRALDSSISLHSKKDLIERFVASVNTSADVDLAWRQFVEAQREIELENIILEHNLQPEATREFMEQAFRDGAVSVVGTAIAKTLPRISMFAPSGEYATRKRNVIEVFAAFFDRFFGLG